MRIDYHKSIHDKGKEYTCSICNQKFLSQTKLADHLSRDHDESLYSCSICGKKFKSKKALDYHDNTHKTDNNNNCSASNEQLIKQNEVTQPITALNAGKVSPCSL